MGTSTRSSARLIEADRSASLGANPGRGAMLSRRSGPGLCRVSDMDLEPVSKLPKVAPADKRAGEGEEGHVHDRVVFPADA
jgi:hypothetical protein